MKKIKLFVIGALAFASFSAFALAEAEIDGYCTVCYIAADKAVKGLPEFKSELDGKTYLFVKKEAKAAFDKDPSKFLPAYDGLCSYGVSLGKEFDSDPEQFSVVDGVIYLNSSAETKKLFDADPEKFIAEANAKWETVKKEIEAKKAEQK